MVAAVHFTDAELCGAECLSRSKPGGPRRRVDAGQDSDGQGYTDSPITAVAGMTVGWAVHRQIPWPLRITATSAPGRWHQAGSRFWRFSMYLRQRLFL